MNDKPVPSAQARAWIAALPPAPPIWSRAIADVRGDDRERALACGGAPEPVVSVEELDAGGVPARLYRPTGDEQDVLVWAHGGAWMFGDLDCCDAVVRALANRAGCAVLPIDYRLAPEHRFPAAIDDAWAATVWAAGRFSRVAVGGDSAGGNLAAAAALRARDKGLELALQLLVYPVLDYGVEKPFYHDFAQRYAEFAGLPDFGMRRHTEIRYIWQIYVPDSIQRLQQDAAPMRAISVRGAAPAFLITAEHDILRGEAEEYAGRLQAAGVPAELRNYAGQIHGFFGLAGVMDDARDAIAAAAAALRRAFAERALPAPGTAGVR